MAIEILWNTIHQIPIYDPAIMTKCKYIDNALYMPSSDTFATPVLKFIQDDGSDSIYIDVYAERIAGVDSPEDRSKLFSPTRTLDCSKHKVRITFKKDELSELLQHSIASNSYMWVSEKFESKVKPAFEELADLLTKELNFAVIYTGKQYILSSGEGVISPKNSTTVAGKFSGIIIESIPTGNASRSNSYSVIAKIPRLVSNEVFFPMDECVLLYADRVNNLFISIDGSRIERGTSNSVKLKDCIITTYHPGGGPLHIPNESLQELTDKKLHVPKSKFENRLLNLGNEAKGEVTAAKALTRKATQRFASLTR